MASSSDVVNTDLFPQWMGIQIVPNVVIVSDDANKQKYCAYSLIYGTIILVEPDKGFMQF